MGFLSGKRALIAGVASKRSIAYGIAEAMHREGAELAFTYQGERLKDRVADMASTFDSSIVLPCDVSSDEEIDQTFKSLREEWGTLDCLVHSIAFAPKDQLDGDFVENTTREGFNTAHDISSYSLLAMGRAARPMMTGHPSSILTLSYLGAVRGMPNYNVMGLAKASLEANVRYMSYAMGEEGIRVNGISAGPIRTLAASGIGDFRKLQDEVAKAAPLKRNVTIEEVGNAGAFLCSDLASGITGEITYVDGGFSTVATV
ncbi:MAG: enoyl-ACP reductase FabI [bacterium]